MERHGNSVLNSVGKPRAVYRTLLQWCEENQQWRFMFQDVKSAGITIGDLQLMLSNKGIRKIGIKKVQTNSGKKVQAEYQFVRMQRGKP